MATLFSDICDLFTPEGLRFGATVEAVHLLVFVVVNGFYYWCEKNPSLDKYRIRPHVQQTEQLNHRTIANLLMSHLVATPYLALLVYPFFAWRGLKFDAPFPPVYVAIVQIFVSMVVEDALFYWAHRALHHPLIYKHIHKQHHLYKNTVSYAAEFANPIEQTLANVIPTYAGPLLCGMNMNMLCVWILLRLWETFEGHSGYELPYSPWRVCLKIQGGARRHDFHHSHNVGSFGSLFTFWDWVMGTDKAYKTHLAKTHGAQVSPPKDTNEDAVEDVVGDEATKKSK